MKSNILILSHKKLTQTLEHVLAQLAPHTSTITIKDVGFGGLEHFVTHKLADHQPSILITGGAHWAMLKKSNLQLAIPTVPIPITRFDLLSAIVEAQAIGHAIAIIQYEDQLDHLQQEMLHFFPHIQFISYASNKEVFSICDQLNKQQIDVVIGTGFVCEVAESFGLRHVFLHSEDSVKSVIEHVLRIEEARTTMFEVANKWSIEMMKTPVMSPSTQQTPYLAYTVQPISELGRRILTDVHSTAQTTTFTIAKFRLLQPIPLKEWAMHARQHHVQMTFYPTDQYIYTLLRGEEAQFMKCFTFSFSKVKKCGVASIQHEQLDAQRIEKALQEADFAYNVAKVGTIELLNAQNPYAMLLALHEAKALPAIQLLTPLLAQRNKERLLDTLELLLDHGLSITTVSNHLGISRQTVYSLMKRIEQLIGLLSDVNRRFLLSFEVRIYRLQRALDKVTTTYAIQKQL